MIPPRAVDQQEILFVRVPPRQFRGAEVPRGSESFNMMVMSGCPGCAKGHLATLPPIVKLSREVLSFSSNGYLLHRKVAGGGPEREVSLAGQQHGGESYPPCCPCGLRLKSSLLGLLHSRASPPLPSGRGPPSSTISLPPIIKLTTQSTTHLKTMTTQ